jgi:membrane carboxypeptidase/penicillin-binding protein PbpC
MGSSEYPFTVAVKTGTSRNWRDAWTVAWSRKYLVGVWIGHPDYRPMRELSGFGSAAVLAQRIMLALHPQARDGLVDLSFPPPRDLRPYRICALTGLLTTQACDRNFLEWFRPGQEPTERCNAHIRLAVDTRNGFLASHRTSPAHIEVRTFTLLKPRYAAWAVQAGLPHPPRNVSPLVDGVPAKMPFKRHENQSPGPFNPISPFHPHTAPPSIQTKTRSHLSSMKSPAGVLTKEDTSKKSLVNQVITPTLTLPHQGGGIFQGTLLFPLPWRPPARRSHASERRGVRGREQKWKFLSPQVKVVSPGNGMRFIRDPETPPALASLALEAVVDPPTSQIVWYMDGKPFKIVDYPYSARWPMKPGRHTFQARIPYSHAISATITIDVF